MDELIEKVIEADATLIADGVEFPLRSLLVGVSYPHGEFSDVCRARTSRSGQSQKTLILLIDGLDIQNIGSPRGNGSSLAPPDEHFRLKVSNHRTIVKRNCHVRSISIKPSAPILSRIVISRFKTDRSLLSRILSHWDCLVYKDSTGYLRNGIYTQWSWKRPGAGTVGKRDVRQQEAEIEQNRSARGTVERGFPVGSQASTRFSKGSVLGSPKQRWPQQMF